MAIKNKADYIALGACFETKTKPTAPIVSLEMIKMVRQKYDIPTVAIGGITIDNIGSLKETGIQCFALINSIFSSTLTSYRQLNNLNQKFNMNKNKKLFEQSEVYIPGGVNSPVRAFGSVGGTPIFFKAGIGSRLIDENDKEYIDYINSWGPMIVGHAHPEIINAVKNTAELLIVIWRANIKRTHNGRITR